MIHFLVQEVMGKRSNRNYNYYYSKKEYQKEKKASRSVNDATGTRCENFLRCQMRLRIFKTITDGSKNKLGQHKILLLCTNLQYCPYYLRG